MSRGFIVFSLNYLLNFKHCIHFTKLCFACQVRFFVISFNFLTYRSNPPKQHFPTASERALSSFYHGFLPVSTPPPPKNFPFFCYHLILLSSCHKNKKICNNRRKIFTSRGNRAYSISARRKRPPPHNAARESLPCARGGGLRSKTEGLFFVALTHRVLCSHCPSIEPWERHLAAVFRVSS